jgi:class 3 adenylate cyclase
MGEINETQLDERLAALEARRTWSPRLVSKLEHFLREAPDRALFRINPLSFAAERGLAEDETIDLFLHATVERLFEMNWMLFCPICSGVVQSFQQLNAVEKHYYCNPCQAGFDAKLDEFIAIAFTVSPEVRDIAFHHPEQLSARDYCLEHCHSTEGRLPDGSSFVDMLKNVAQLIAHLPPGETTRLELDARPGTLVGISHEGGLALLFAVEGAPAAMPQSLELVFGEQVQSWDSRSIAPGPLVLNIRNDRAQRGTLLLAALPAGFTPEPHQLSFQPFLSGKRLLTSQTFRNLFRTEVIGGGGGLGITDIALLFTDLKGSTHLYERIGDLNAFNLVQQHFERLQEITVRHRGAIIKTIGDAVMAAFLEPADAVNAALAMRQEIAAFRSGHGGRDLVLKIGIHKGAAIAVTLNDRLDYFGQTVNIASRVQELAEADDIYLSEAVFAVPSVKAALSELQLEMRSTTLRGIVEEQRVYRVGAGQAA